ncbi:MAG: sulfite exporter TauE/SafE family protein [Deltaproteobacteria bacterium]|nr:sulfite exporter TauE/SafE family protein [Deltaproteobacteria bacterium]
MLWPAYEIALPLALVCAIAFTTETALGFGATLITVALGSFFLDLAQILPALVPLNLVVSLYLVVRYGRHVDRSFLAKRLVPFMALGLPIGLFAFASLDASMLKRAFGVFLVGVSVLELYRMRVDSPVKHLDTWSERALLLAGGAIHGAFATGGPMAVYVTSRVLEDKNVYRATLSALWTILNLAMLASYAWRGELDGSTAGLGVCLAPSAAIGMLLGELLHARVPVATFRTVVFGMLVLAGLVLVLRG